MRKLISLSALLLCFIIAGFNAVKRNEPTIKKTVDHAIRPVMEKYKVPGMAIAITLEGKQYFYNFGVASWEKQDSVTSKTLFEIGSISKTFTATLATYAQARGELSLSDKVSKHLPGLRGTNFDKVSLVHLGTHTPGGMPLQVPDHIKSIEELMDYFKQWNPRYEAGTQRVYSNLSIGLLGMIAAKSMDKSFDDAMEKKLFPELGMVHSYISIPADQMKLYAQGYSKTDLPVRLSSGILGHEAYSVKSNAEDMIRFVEHNMEDATVDNKLQQAILNTHTGYFKSGEITQDLIWEQYAYPVTLSRLLEGNSDPMIYQANKAIPITPPLKPQSKVLINKTGSTNGFSAYVAFIPSKKIGIVMLANKNCPIAPRVTAAYQILMQMDSLVSEKK